MTENIITTEDQAPIQEQAPAPNLTLQDLILVAQIIQLTSTRGGFRAEELSIVGDLYTKLVAFLEASGSVVRQPADQELAETTVDEDAAETTVE